MADEMVQKLPNDIILEIITGLPLKYAIRCRTLNKYFYSNISIPKLIASTNVPPIIFHESKKGANHRLTIISSPLRNSTALPNEVSILHSCNGVLLLDSTWLGGETNYYLFNPLTGGLKLLNVDIRCWDFVGLAISVPEKPSSSLSSTFDFKLVELQIDSSYRLRPFTRLWFGVHVPSQSNNNLMEIRSFYLDYHGSFRTRGFGAVYAHGSVHWLGVDATAIAAFDLETEQPTIMDGPLRNAPTKIFQYWFGLSQGSLQYIAPSLSSSKLEIVVHKHNYATQEWCVAHKIPIGEHIMKSFSGYCLTPVLFFDGQNVFLHNWKWIRGSLMKEIHVYDLSISEWKMSEQVDEDAYNHRYMKFVPTIARVSDGYLSALKMSPRLGPTLRRLQQILLGGS